jgi:hypothetical protein
MKSLSVVAIAISLLLIILTSPPYSRPDATGAEAHNSEYWVNPDGSRGLVAGGDNQSASPRRTDPWVNPDGARGTDHTASDQHHPGQSSASGYTWVNPDGTAGKMSAAQARVDGPDSTF